MSETDLASELVRLLQLGPGPERWDALRALQKLGPDAAAVVPELVAALSDPDLAYRMQAVLTLVGIGGPAVPPLLETFAAGDEDLRKAIIVTLGRIGQPAACAIPLLESLLEDPALDRVAAQALDRIRPVHVADLVPHFRRTFFQALGLCAGCALAVGGVVLLAWSGQALQGG
ncbi:MAG: HEAT repeat domain-containing protein, partial [Planctomycetia bacterium]|nr:HEAT repeat domain-containing protein [Planctomycetia bacterium]